MRIISGLTCMFHPWRKAISVSDDETLRLCGECYRAWMRGDLSPVGRAE